jgi:hypothetical protein
MAPNYFGYAAGKGDAASPRGGVNRSGLMPQDDKVMVATNPVIKITEMRRGLCDGLKTGMMDNILTERV